jgi:hypothetical protein
VCTCAAVRGPGSAVRALRTHTHGLGARVEGMGGRHGWSVRVEYLYSQHVYRNCFRMANFGWDHPNRVVSQAVFRKSQKNAAGHPEFGAERKERSSPWGFALIASRLDARALKHIKKNSRKKPTLEGRLRAERAERSGAERAFKKVGGRLEAGFPLV